MRKSMLDQPFLNNNNNNNPLMMLNEEDYFLFDDMSGDSFESEGSFSSETEVEFVEEQPSLDNDTIENLSNSSSSVEETDKEKSRKNKVRPLPIVQLELPQLPPQKVIGNVLSVKVETSPTNEECSVKDQVQPSCAYNKLSAYLKPAKGREDQYIAGDFPATLLCNPYKYDLKLIGEIGKSDSQSPNSNVTSITELLDQQRKLIQDELEFLSLNLVDADTYTVPAIPTDANNQVQAQNTAINTVIIKKEFVIVESITKVHSRERIIRFSFNLCSFHVKRRAFRLAVLNKNTGEYVFISSPFKTFARRRDGQIAQAKVAFQRNLCNNNMYFMQQKLRAQQQQQQEQQQEEVTKSGKVQKKGRKFGKSCAPYVLPTKSTTTTAQIIPSVSPPVVAQQQELMFQEERMAPSIVYAPSPINYVEPFPMYTVPSPLMPTTFYRSAYPMHGCFAYSVDAILQNMCSQERTSFAIQLMNSLSPAERQTVDFYLNYSNPYQHMSSINVVPIRTSKQST
jgi:hypothetical protein